MSRFLISAFSIPLFLAAILFFRNWYKKYYGTPFSRMILLFGILLFIVYAVFQTATHIYSLGELAANVVQLFAGFFLIVGFYLVFFTSYERYSVPEDIYSSVNKRILIVCSGTFLIALFLPPYAAFSIESYCSDEHRILAKRIIDAVNQYKISENKLPDDIAMLIPTHLTEIPSPKCFSVYQPFVPALTETDFLRSMDYWVMMDLIKLKKLDYHLKKCEWVEDDVYSVDLYLLVPTIDLDGKDRYNFSSNSWERIPYRHNECLTYDTSD